MTLYSSLFRLASRFTLLGWLLIICLPAWQYTNAITVSVVVTLLCALYAYLIFLGRRHDEPGSQSKGNFWSLNGVMSLLKSPRAVLAGWIHYLAFDLMVGIYIINDAAKYDINHFLLIPCLLLTLMFGPAGLLAYFGLRELLSSGLLPL